MHSPIRPRKYIKLGRTQFLRGESIEDWSPELIKEQLLEFHKVYNHRFTVKLFGLYRHPTVDKKLSEVIGKPSSRKFFHYAACYHFVTWEKALESCGLEPTRTAHNKFWNQDLIVLAIKALYKSGHSLTVKSIWNDRKGSTTKILYSAVGKKTTASGLHDAARRYFGSWDKALQASGIDSELIKEKPFWTKNKVIRAIQAARENEVALNTEKIGRDCSQYTERIIKNALGKKRMGRSLHGGAYRIFGSWDRALYAANINPSQVRKRKFIWNRTSLSRVLNVLYENEIPINSTSLVNDRSEQTNSIIFDYTGQRIKAPFLFKMGKNDFGSWDQALKYSGFKLSEVRKSGSPCFKDEEKIVNIIRLLNRHECALNRSALAEKSHIIKYLIEDHFGSAISGLSVLNAALLIFENWDEALWESGLDPSSIRLRSRPHTSSLPIIPHQKEDVKVDGDRRMSKFVGWAPKNPEEILEEQETSNKFWETMDRIEDEEKEVLQSIFEAILNLHHYRDQDQLAKFVSEDLGGSVSEEKVKTLLGKFKNKFSTTEDNSLFN